MLTFYYKICITYLKQYISSEWVFTIWYRLYLTLTAVNKTIHIETLRASWLLGNGDVPQGHLPSECFVNPSLVIFLFY